MPVAAAASACTVPTTSLGQTSRGSGRWPQMRLRPCGIPVEVARRVQRIALAGGVVVHARIRRSVSPRCRSWTRTTPSPARTPRARAVRTHSSFGPTAWLDSSGARPIQDRVGTEFLCQRVDFGGRPGVDAVEDGGPQRRQSVVAQHQARADAADAHGGDRRLRRASAAVSRPLISQTSRHHVASASTSAQPGRGRSIDMRRSSQTREHAGGVHQDALGAPGAHVDSEKQVHGATLRRAVPHRRRDAQVRNRTPGLTSRLSKQLAAD